MHVLNVTYTLGLEAASGTAERTRQLSRQLAKRGLRCTVLMLAIGPEEERAVEGVEVVALPSLWPRYFVPRAGPAVLRRIAALVREADVVHLMGHWSILNAIVYAFARRYRKPYLVSPAGTLAQAGRSLWLKRLYNAIVGRRLVRDASGWIAVTRGEFPDFARYGIGAERVTVLPNGVEAVSRALAPAADEFARRFAPYILYVGRLHPVKGPDLLLEAFRAIGPRFPRHRLLFIGPDDGIRAALEERAHSFAEGERIVFLGYRGGAEKDAAFRNAELLVIPSRSEAMSLVALEAAAVATPVVLTDRCGFDELAEVDSRLVVPATAEGIARSVCDLLEGSGELARIGKALQAHVTSRFGWDAVMDRFVGLCEGLARCDR